MTHAFAKHEDRPIAGVIDPAWDRLRREAEAMVRQEPALASFAMAAILNHPSLETAVVHRVASRLGHPALSSDLIAQTFQAALDDEPAIGDSFRADMAAVVDRDPACSRLLEPVLYFKGFHAIQAYRLAHRLWNRGRQDFALYIQSRASEVFQTDIHPAARIGRGIFLDHATGLVVGMTSVIEDNVLDAPRRDARRHRQGAGDRHPKIRRGVLSEPGPRSWAILRWANAPGWRRARSCSSPFRATPPSLGCRPRS
jgi:serine O-acetyltransferase